MSTEQKLDISQAIEILGALRSLFVAPPPKTSEPAPVEVKRNPCPAQPEGAQPSEAEKKPAEAPAPDERKTVPTPADEKKATVPAPEPQGLGNGTGAPVAPPPVAAPPLVGLVGAPGGPGGEEKKPATVVDNAAVEGLVRSVVHDTLGVGAQAPEAAYLELITRQFLTTTVQRILPQLRAAAEEFYRTADKRATDLGKLP